jgi:hypothetical protein
MSQVVGITGPTADYAESLAGGQAQAAGTGRTFGIVATLS